MGDMKPSSAVVRSSILVHIQQVALTCGLDPLALLRRAGIPRRHLDNSELTLPVRAIVELLEIGAHSSGVEDFGLRVGESRGVPDLGPVILMLREAATARDALRTLASLLYLHTNGISMHLEETSTPVFQIELMAADLGPCTQAIDSALAGMTHLIRWVLGEDWVPVSVSFMHSRPTSNKRFERFFRCPVDFLQDFNGIVLRRRDLDRKLPGSAPALRQQVERYIHSINLARSDTYVYNVTEVVTATISRGELSADNIAKYLGTDRRTLNRRLSRAGLNYSAVVENVRRNLAGQYLLGDDRPLSDIAGLVGFNDLSSFTRWFHSSFGNAPSQWRKAKAEPRPFAPK
jgi:AraC-like DNA-binding protein